MMSSKKILTLLAFAGLVLGTACNNNDKSSSVTQQNRSPVSTASTWSFPVFGGYNPGSGKIYTDAQYASQFNTIVHYMLAAYIDPQQVGDVDAQTGVTFRGYVEAGANGAVTSTSGIEIEIKDSYAIKGKNDNGETISSLKFGAAATALNITTNTAVVTFRTSGAEYTLTGVFDQNTFLGTFKFQNSASYSASEATHSGDGIMFQVPTCQFFRCN